MTLYHIDYDSNNSGGDWWLKDKHWRALEQNGWRVHWFTNDEFRHVDEEGRWLGALAGSACIVVEGVSESHAEAGAKGLWEAVTGQDPDADGCPCCGHPHSFYSTAFERCQWHAPDA